MLYTPRPYQHLITCFELANPRCAVFAGMGMGKTVSTLTALDARHMAGEDHPALVLAPLRVARSVWPEEARKWQHLSHISVSPIVGHASQRAAALKREASVYTINYDNLPWLVDTLNGRWPFRTVVGDESPRLKSFRSRQGGKRAGALRDVMKREHTDHWINLTGTPTPNGLEDLWGQMAFIDGGQRLGRTFEAFKQRWFQAVPGGNGYQQIRPLPHAQAEIQDLLKDVCITLDPADWFDLDKPIENVIQIELPSAARQQYKQMERDFFTEIEGEGVEAFNSAAKSAKLLQISSGFIYHNLDGSEGPSDDRLPPWTPVHDAKLEALESVVVEAAGAPVLVAYHFKPDLARILARFKQARQIKTKKDEDDWNAGRIPIGVMHPASGGHGLNLQHGGNIICFYSHWWSLENRQQIIERIGPVRQMQAGYNRPVFIYDLVARGTLEEDVLERHRSKASVQDILMAAFKRWEDEQA
jgi:SNF2 family DNA or RNA helicase